MKKKLLFLMLLLQVGLMAQEKLTCDQALQKLIDGNKRFTEDKSLHPDRTSERRQELVSTQEPFACIVGCSDSRVSPEILFDQGIGDLFIVRVAGNVIEEIEMESVEYSVHYLGACLVMVLGHENCGAVKTVLSGQTKDIEAIAKHITPAIRDTKCAPNEQLECSIKANAKASAEVIKKDAKFAKLISENKLKVVAGYYNFHSGKVELLQ